MKRIVTLKKKITVPSEFEGSWKHLGVIEACISTEYKHILLQKFKWSLLVALYQSFHVLFFDDIISNIVSEFVTIMFELYIS